LANLAEAARQRENPGTLGITEGNGRYAEMDHHRFIQIAESSAVKAAVYVDLCVKLLEKEEGAAGKEHLRRVSNLLAGF
jgi:hypothetical protein